MTGLAMLVQQGLAADPFDGAVFAFRGRRAGLIKLLWHDGVGLCMLPSALRAASLFGHRQRRTAGLRSRHRNWRPYSTGVNGARRFRSAGRSWPARSYVSYLKALASARRERP